MPPDAAAMPTHGKAWLEAAKRGDVAAMRPLLAADASLMSYRGKGCSLGFIGHSALHWAAAKGHSELVAWLLGEGADTAVRNNAESTPLHTCAQNGHVGVAQALLAAGADGGAVDADGHTARAVALERGNADIARLIEQSAGRASLQRSLAALGSESATWKVSAMKEALRLGGVDCAGIAEKAELVALVVALRDREGVAEPARQGEARAPDPSHASPPLAVPDLLSADAGMEASEVGEGDEWRGRRSRTIKLLRR